MAAKLDLSLSLMVSVSKMLVAQVTDFFSASLKGLGENLVFMAAVEDILVNSIWEEALSPDKITEESELLLMYEV